MKLKYINNKFYLLDTEHFVSNDVYALGESGIVYEPVKLFYGTIKERCNIIIGSEEKTQGLLLLNRSMIEAKLAITALKEVKEYADNKLKISGGLLSDDYKIGFREGVEKYIQDDNKGEYYTAAEFEEYGRKCFYEGRSINNYDDKGRAIFKNPTYEGYKRDIIYPSIAKTKTEWDVEIELQFEKPKDNEEFGEYWSRQKFTLTNENTPKIDKDGFINILSIK